MAVLSHVTMFASLTFALTKKTLLLLVRRKWISTLIQAYILPLLVLLLLLNMQNFGNYASSYGFGSVAPIRSLKSSLEGTNKDFVIVSNSSMGPDVARVIDQITKPLSDLSSRVLRLDSADKMNEHCVANLQGNSNCHAALIFDDSPLTPGGYRTWNYTIRDGSPRNSYSYNVLSHDNELETLWLPLQLAVDNAILNSTDSPNIYSYTTTTQEKMDELNRKSYMTLLIGFFLLVFFLHLLPVIYHTVSSITMEREQGMSQLIDAMGGGAAARVMSSVLALNLIYLPLWIITGSLYWHYYFIESNAGILIFWNILAGASITNSSIFAAAFFTRRRISSVFVCAVMVALVGAAVAQFSRDSRAGTGSVAALSLIFPSMNYIFALARMARFPIALQPVDVNASVGPPQPSYQQEFYFIALYAFWLMLILQIIVYPLLAIVVERALHGISFKGRSFANADESNHSSVVVETSNLRKIYPPSIWRKIFCCAGKSKNVTAVDGLNLVAHKNQILCLLGVNGSGKTTTLDLISGLQGSTTGDVRINAPSRKIGICPQRNIIYPQLTVYEHVKFWSEVKGTNEDVETINRLIEACDLANKATSPAGKLSGGQKRKLQLACMFVGNSTVCLMDEVTTGLDPLSRRVIWNIILAERSKRSMLFTTHFLDEGEVLSDHIVLLSKGNIKCQGSGAELKNQYGGGYSVHVPRGAEVVDVGVPPTIHQDRVLYNTPDTKSAGEIITKLERAGHTEVAMHGPTIESVFLSLTTEVDESLKKEFGGAKEKKTKKTKKSEKEAVQENGNVGIDRMLVSGKPTSTLSQILVLMRKRMTILPRYWIAPLLVLVIPSVVPSQLNLILEKYKFPQCDQVVNRAYPASTVAPYFPSGGSRSYSYWNTIPIGPPSANNTISKVMEEYPIAKNYRSYRPMYNETFTFENSLDSFQKFIREQTEHCDYGGVWLGDGSSPATLAFMGQYGAFGASSLFNFWSNVRGGIPIGMKTGSVSQSTSTSAGGQAIFWIAFLGLIFAVYPPFFALYPSFEKTHNIRALQYANGVRPFPLWIAHLLVDFLIIILISLAFTVTVAIQFGNFWLGPGWLFLVNCLYGLSTLLIAYLMARVCRSQLASFLGTFGVMILLYAVAAFAFILPQSYIEPEHLERATDAIYYSLGLINPMINLWKALGVGTNLYKTLCRSNQQVQYPGSIYAYGGPILLLIIQVLFLLLLLVYLESNRSFSPLRQFVHRKTHKSGKEEAGLEAKSAIAKEAARVEVDAADLLRLTHVNKTFGRNTAVDDVSFGLGEGEILALLGPNGAGKTTIANMIMGELRPDSGRIYLRGIDVVRDLRLAQKSLGVCPQFDALDLMTARQHLEFYARIRGVADVRNNVEIIMGKIGLAPHADKSASKLSGGNKRKLSLAIALIGNPDVLILDEPSSAMDAAAKRVMWKLLAEVAPGRSVLLTTHSMEEADALATRAAIISKRLLAFGTTQALREQYSNFYQVVLVLATAPESSEEEMRAVEDWVRAEFVDVSFEGDSLGGQVKFMVSNGSSSASSSEIEGHTGGGGGRRGVSIGQLIQTLEANKEVLGLVDYSIGAPTLEKVFLNVVKDNYVEHEEKRKKAWWKLW